MDAVYDLCRFISVHYFDTNAIKLARDVMWCGGGSEAQYHLRRRWQPDMSRRAREDAQRLILPAASK